MDNRSIESMTPDPLTSLLQSATKEFEDEFAVMLERAGRGEGYDNSSMYWSDKCEHFLNSKLTEAFNKGKQTK